MSGEKAKVSDNEMEKGIMKCLAKMLYEAGKISQKTYDEAMKEMNHTKKAA